MKVWQTLPLLPTNYGDSPYQSCDARALNPYFIDFEELRKEGLLEESEYKNVDWAYDERRVEYGKLFLHKANVLKKAFARFDREDEGWRTFLNQGEYADFGVFMALKCRFGHQPWTEWEDYRVYDEKKITEFVQKNRDEVEFWQFTQYIFLKQWNALKAYANGNGIEIMGDMPIYVAYDSVEMWKHGKELFLLDEEGNPELVAGVPPDAFSDDGQLWGNPLYDWEYHKETGYDWWMKRIGNCYQLYDIVRNDHFRGFDEYYSIPYGDPTAENGKWMPGPGYDLFRTMKEKLGERAVIAEDLGFLTDSVIKLIEDTGYPGMKILQFAFDSRDESDYLPSKYTPNCVVYTGTHDNDTVVGWFNTIEGPDKDFAKSYVGITDDNDPELNWKFIRCAMASVADTAVIPIQDYLGLGSEARTNIPSTLGINWKWRLKVDACTDELANKMKELAKECNR